ncbi:SDR family NAD(P)-dependent oxidoreductase [Aldersonia sp. NBC_00410]|uniref:SDR family NAD(P)-dependent oxidoreductase n=1 Tax=Aldersonia sp. NBC_00410 TaxID=2975954 RepID=UPI002259E947|nr:SDR family NAD(P)-dependent oxidoreductase [Aldersonia sp. NBC_00410]MCX5046675.1 SDR family NAD(P)-dependent oxidoreductase [Aldersonia sp. NBC_00410]
MSYFEGRVFALTGAAAGIGKQLAVELSRRGARLALADVDAAGLDETAHLCGKHSLAVVADVTSPPDMARFAAETVARYGGVDAVINNAGVLHVGGVEISSHAEFEQVMRTNFGGVVNGTKAFLPFIVESDRGHVVNLSSAFGLIGVGNYAPYNSSKFAIRGFTESLRSEMRVHPNVAVTCVFPGGVRTTIARSALHAAGVDGDRAIERFEQRVARTSPEKAARVILAGVQRRKPKVLIGADARLADVAARVCGASYEKATGLFTGR